MNVHYCLGITSCSRHDLLEKTMESFARSVNIKPRVTVIVEDSDLPMPAFLVNDIHRWTGSLSKIIWLSNGMRRGQVFSVDKLITFIPKDIERLFILEDDWMCEKQLDLNAGFEILERYPKIGQVVYRNDWPHTLIDLPPFEGFKVAQPYWRGSWGGWTFNPCLTRVNTVKQFGTYASQAGYVNGLKHEEVFSKKFLDAGFRIAALPYNFRHIGSNRSRSIEPLPPASKILIAVPACDVFDYKKFESGDSPHFNKATNFNQEPYGTNIHISHIKNDRIRAVRDTWAKDVAKFPNVTFKFFYGTPFEREPLPDEVVLDVPSDYEHLSHRTIAICKYAKDNGFDWVVKADDDTAIWVDKLVHEITGFTGDYGGYTNGKVASGGPSYILSRRAFTIIADLGTPSVWAEDVNTSKILFNHNIQVAHLDGHKSGRSQHWFFGDKFDASKLNGSEVAIHAVQPEVMRDWYEHKNGRTTAA